MPLSSGVTEQISRGNVADVFLLLIDITHPSFPSTFRFVANHEDVTSNGNLYSYVTLNVPLPPEIKDELPSVNATISDVDPALHSALRQVDSIGGGRPMAEARWVLEASPDITEIGPFLYPISEIDGDAMALRMTLGVQDLLDQPFPKKRFLPRFFPLLF